ncbi:hypothetical protein [Dactylosporangium sp. CA-139066]|uniref:hypothetical protein n=1 Tax=Dactylosporangium sp. CA-139066 TaxID=3239930 RepID=UPI003D93EEB4
MRSNVLFSPFLNLPRPVSGVRIIAGDAAVGQACYDPATFADATTLVEGFGSSAPPVDARARALLRMVWPSTVAQARLQWSRRFTPAADVEDLVASVVGIPPATLRAAVTRSAEASRTRDNDFARAATPMAVLHEAVGFAVRARASSPSGTETVLDELLFWRGLGRERVSLDEVSALVTALTAAAWDATHTAPQPSRSLGWLRVTTQAVVLDGETIPAGEHCLLLVDAAEPADRPARPALQTLRWLSPGSPNGAGATFARLAHDAMRKEPSKTAAA